MAKKNYGQLMTFKVKDHFIEKLCEKYAEKMSKEYHGWFIIYKTLKVKNSNGISE